MPDQFKVWLEEQNQVAVTRMQNKTQICDDTTIDIIDDLKDKIESTVDINLLDKCEDKNISNRSVNKFI